MKEINSIAKAIKVINTLVEGNFYTNQLWFRGVFDKAYKLRPSVFRPQPRAEEEIIAHLRAIRPSEVDQTLPIDTLAVLQHYGAPTRLLDWSTNILVSLFFSVNEKPEKDGKLFALEPLKLNLCNRYDKRKPQCSIYDSSSPEIFIRACMAMSSDISEVISRLKRYGASIDLQTDIDNNPIFFSGSWAVLAPLRNARLIAQHGAFTIQGGKLGPNADLVDSAMWSGHDVSPVFIDEQDNKRDYLHEYVVPSSSKCRISSELRALGITAQSLFPELEYTARSITKF